MVQMPSQKAFPSLPKDQVKGGTEGNGEVVRAWKIIQSGFEMGFFFTF